MISSGIPGDKQENKRRWWMMTNWEMGKEKHGNEEIGPKENVGSRFRVFSGFFSYSIFKDFKVIHPLFIFRS